MSSVVPLASVPSQSASIQLDDIRYSLRFRDLGDMMAVDISINEVVVVTGSRVVAGAGLIPYQYLEEDGGNFIFITQGGDFPFYDKFGVTQALLYVTAEELAAIRGD